MNSIQEFGVEIIQYLQTFHPQLDALMGFFAILVKAEYFLVLIFPVLFWNFKHRFFLKLLIVILIDMVLGETLRILLAQPRPWWIAEMVPIDAVTSVYSSPAGYSSFSVLFFGAMVLHFRKKWVTALCVFIILATSIAKLYEAATLPDHLILGMLQGGIMLWVFTKYSDAFVNYWIGLSKKKLILHIILICIGSYLMTYAATLIQLSYDLPSNIVKYKVIPSERLSGGGTPYFIGFLMTALLSLNINTFNHSNNIELKISLWKRIFASILCVAGIIVIFIIIRPALEGMFASYWYVGIMNLLVTLITGWWIYHLLPKKVIYRQ